MSTYYQDNEEDSFEDFLEWRRWKRETARGGNPAAAAPRAAPAHAQAAPSQAPPAYVQAPRQAAPAAKKESSPAVRVAPVTVHDDRSKGKEEVAAASTQKVAVQGQEGSGVSSAGEKWVTELHSANERKKKELRVGILEQTRGILEAGHYESEVGATVELDVAGAGAGRTVFGDDHKFSNPPAPYNTTAHFVKADAIDTALFLIEKKGVNPLVVIPAAPKNIGDGFPGSSSLEEQFYRRTTALSAVEGDFKYDIPEKGSIYLPSVQVFRDGEAKTGYQMVKAPRKVAFLLASSVESPPYEPKGRSYTLNAESRTLLEAKVSAILSAGIEKGHDAIVISAFGCGFNKTPPQCVAAVFRDLLTGKFSNTYKHVTFAIIEDDQCMKAHNPQGNLVPFQQEFLTVSKASAEKTGCCAGKSKGDGEKKEKKEKKPKEKKEKKPKEKKEKKEKK